MEERGQKSGVVVIPVVKVGSSDHIGVSLRTSTAERSGPRKELKVVALPPPIYNTKDMSTPLAVMAHCCEPDAYSM